ncbi:MAG: dipicolinate synthase subunit B [Christensenellales bacterium]|jgi:dipicolinate synthase subunit B
MDVKNKVIGFALTGSFCTLEKAVAQIKKLTDAGAEVIPMATESVLTTDTRFGKAADWIESIESITNKKIWSSITQTEPIGPQSLLDILIVAPCTGNTLAKIALGITDNAVMLAIKAQLRNSKPVLIAVSTNDGLANNAKNIGALQAKRDIFFVPYTQDDPIKKPNSLVAVMDALLPAAECALEHKQLQPMLYK